MKTIHTTASQLATKGMLVNLTVSRWQARRRDADVTERVNREAEADSAAGNYHKKLFPWNPPEWQAITKAHSQCAQRHYKWTLPWYDSGWRLLPRDVYFDYMAEMRELRNAYDQAVQAFCVAYPRLRNEAKAHLGKLFKDDDYPHASLLRSRFRIVIEQAPLATEGDFRIEIDQEALDDAAKSYGELVEEAARRANRDLWMRLIESVEAAANSVDKYSKALKIKGDDDRAPALRESTLQNLKQIADLLPRLDIGQDPKLEAMRQSVVERLCDHNIDALRVDPKQRTQFTRNADDVVKKMRAFMGGQDEAA
jgi:hypothetical protein